MRKSNYDVTRDQMREEFLKFDQETMIRKFSLEHDGDYLYIPFVLRRYRIGRKNGVVERTEDGFSSVEEADFSESMTIYDVLCTSKPDCRLAGRFCPADSLRGTVSSLNADSSLFSRDAERFRGKTEKLRRACSLLGTPADMSGDAAFILYPFPFLPVTLQFWDADEEFPANLKFMFDENILDFMHFETTFYMTGHILRRLGELTERE